MGGFSKALVVWFGVFIKINVTKMVMGNGCYEICFNIVTTDNNTKKM